MKKLAFIAALISSSAWSHPNGTYSIDARSDVTVTFEFLDRCPEQLGSLSGGLRRLSFSDAAQTEPYLFVSGFYVEQHTADGEVYRQTDEQCVPLDQGEEIPATRNTFAGFSLQRI